MNSLLRFLAKYEFFIYLIAGVVILFSARRTILSWREWKAAIFGLEKENSQRKFNEGLTFLVLGVLVILALFVVNTFITPRVPGVQQLPTPTIDMTQQAATFTPFPTSDTTAQGLIPTITSYFSRGCLPDQIDWTDPQNGGIINGEVELKGTVNIENLGFYKYEYAVSGSESWTTIAAGNETIINAPLGGVWDTGALTPGIYQLRLVVSDNQNNPFPACIIQVTITAPE